MSLIDEIVARAKANKQRIVLPEGTEERTLKAADKIIADEVANISFSETRPKSKLSPRKTD